MWNPVRAIRAARSRRRIEHRLRANQPATRTAKRTSTPRASLDRNRSIVERIQQHVTITEIELKALLVVAVALPAAFAAQHFGGHEPPDAEAIYGIPPEVLAAREQRRVADSLAAIPVNVNTASASELDRLPGVGPATAQRIIEERQRRPFSGAQDLTRVRGIGPAKAEEIAPRATF